jgi:murein DD-endopeptidase MepM/ murein hydrolase activator NlpD
MNATREPTESARRMVRTRLRARVLLPGMVVTACAAVGLALGAFAPFGASDGPVAAPAAEPTRAERAPAEPVTAAAPAPAEILVRVTTEGEMRRGQTLVGSLSSHGVSGVVAHVIATEMSPVFDFRYARPGDSYRLVQNAEGQVVRFDYVRSPVESYSLRRAGEVYVAERHEPELVRERRRLAGVVASSLYEAVTNLGERPDLASDFAEIFAWDVDFSRSVRPGDEFSMLYERLQLEDANGELVYERPGRILAARYSNAADDYMAVYFEPEEGRGGYYRPDGTSVQRQFLKAPLNYRRISSGYSMSRLHPILNVRRPHQGIDYAAPQGTPIWSVADGVVTFRGWSGGFGNLVKVRHNNGFVSTYGHLSRYAESVRVGQRVRQKQVIGYVGSTGLATGPHVCFRLKRNGHYVNPQQVLHQPPSGPPLPEEMRPAFAALRDDLLRELELGGPLPAGIEEAL